MAVAEEPRRLSTTECLSRVGHKLVEARQTLDRQARALDLAPRHGLVVPNVDACRSEPSQSFSPRPNSMSDCHLTNCFVQLSELLRNIMRGDRRSTDRPSNMNLDAIRRDISMV